MTKKELNQYKRQKSKLKRLEEQIEELNYFINSHLNVRKISEKTIESFNELLELYEIQRDEMINIRLDIEKVIYTLDDPIECAIMGYKYIDGLIWEQVCEKMCYSYNTVHHYHRRALQKIKES